MKMQLKEENENELKAEEGTETKLQLEAENGKMHSREQ